MICYIVLDMRESQQCRSGKTITGRVGTVTALASIELERTIRRKLFKLGHKWAYQSEHKSPGEPVRPSSKNAKRTALTPVKADWV